MYRNLTKDEETILKRSFNNWGVFELYADLKILILESILEKRTNFKKNDVSKEVYIYSNDNQNEIAKKLMPVLIGLKIGIIQNKKFLPGLNFAEIVVDHNKNMHYPYIIVNDKAANLVIYGRDIMGNSLLSFFNDIRENQLLIILNLEKEVIGIGRSRFSGKLISQPNIITIDNIQDIGTYYLKDESELTKQFKKAR